MRQSMAGLLAILAMVGCSSPSMLQTSARMPEPGKGSPGRYVVRASQYTFTTDFEIERNDPLIVELERLREKMVETLGIIPPSTPIRVMIFDDRDRYLTFLKSYFPELPDRRAFFIQEGEDQRTVFAVKGDRLTADLRHEVAHALMHGAGCRIPLWLDEGLAEYFESCELPAGRHAGHVQKLAAARQEGWKPSLQRLESIIDLWQMKPADYRESWLWVHYCLHSTEENRQSLIETVRPRDDGPSRLKLVDRLLARSAEPERGVLDHLDRLILETHLPSTVTNAFESKENATLGPGLSAARQKLGLEESAADASTKPGQSKVVHDRPFVPGFNGTSLLEVLGDHLVSEPEPAEDQADVLPGGEPD
jgi:hypothetical protein